MGLSLVAWYYRRACAYVRIGENDKPFENLNKAVELGYNSKQEVEGDATRFIKNRSHVEKIVKKKLK